MNLLLLLQINNLNTLKCKFYSLRKHDYAYKYIDHYLLFTELIMSSINDFILHYLRGQE